MKFDDLLVLLMVSAAVAWLAVVLLDIVIGFFD